MKRSNPCVENLKVKTVTLTLRNSETTSVDKQVKRTLELRDQASRIGKQNQFCPVARSCLTLCVVAHDKSMHWWGNRGVWDRKFNKFSRIIR